MTVESTKPHWRELASENQLLAAWTCLLPPHRNSCASPSPDSFLTTPLPSQSIALASSGPKRQRAPTSNRASSSSSFSLDDSLPWNNSCRAQSRSRSNARAKDEVKELDPGEWDVGAGEGVRGEGCRGERKLVDGAFSYAGGSSLAQMYSFTRLPSEQDGRGAWRVLLGSGWSCTGLSSHFSLMRGFVVWTGAIRHRGRSQGRGVTLLTRARWLEGSLVAGGDVPLALAPSRILFAERRATTGAPGTPPVVAQSLYPRNLGSYDLDAPNLALLIG